MDFRKERLSREPRHLVKRSDYPQPSVSLSAAKRGRGSGERWGLGFKGAKLRPSIRKFVLAIALVARASRPCELVANAEIQFLPIGSWVQRGNLSNNSLPQGEGKGRAINYLPSNSPPISYPEIYFPIRLEHCLSFSFIQPCFPKIIAPCTPPFSSTAMAP